MINVDRQQVLAFRMGNQHLSTPLPPERMLEAAGSCAVQNTPPGTAALAVRARVADLEPAAVDTALLEQKTLLQTWSLRQSPCLFPAADQPVFTTSLLPADEESWRLAVQGFVPMLDGMGRTATEVVKMITEVLPAVLDGQTLTKRELGVELGKQLPNEFSGWFEADTFSNFTAVLVRPLGLTGIFCMGPRKGNEATFVRTDQWLGKRPKQMAAGRARAELVRRYLRCYGPSTPEHLAEWAGVSQTVASRAWQEVAKELTEVTYDGQRTWLLSADTDRLQNAARPDGIRLCPPYDPLSYQRDRGTLVPDGKLHKRVWKHAHNPGLAIKGTDVIGLWRHQRKGRKLTVTVEPLRKLSAADRTGIEAEAESIATFRDCTSASVTFDS